IDGTTIDVQSFSLGLSNTVSLGSASGGAGGREGALHHLTLTGAVGPPLPLPSLAGPRGRHLHPAGPPPTATDRTRPPAAPPPPPHHLLFFPATTHPPPRGPGAVRLWENWGGGLGSPSARGHQPAAPTKTRAWDVVENTELP